MNRLYYGDCLTIMQDWPLQSVDLIYLDPPFNSNRQYNSGKLEGPWIKSKRSAIVDAEREPSARANESGPTK